MLFYGGATTEQCDNCSFNSTDGCLFYAMTGRPAIIADDICTEYKKQNKGENNENF